MCSFNWSAGECGCAAGFSEACKHVFALLHHIEHHVTLYRNGIITATVPHSVIAKYKREPSTQAIENTIAKIIGISKHVRTAATSYGNEYEHYARLRYVKKSKSAHKKKFTSKAGLRLHPGYPVLGASVDGYVNCSFCGSGILEIKCPFSHRDSTLSEYALSANSCIPYSSEKSTYLIKPKHFYHTQVQHQKRFFLKPQIIKKHFLDLQF